MAEYEITAPDGARYRVTAPDDATEDQVMAYAQQNYQWAPLGTGPSYDESKLIPALRKAAARARQGDPEADRAARAIARRIQAIRNHASAGPSSSGQPIEVDLPDGSVAEFPAGTAKDVMRTAILRRLQLNANQPHGAPPTRSAVNETGRQLGLAARHGIEGVGQAAGIVYDPIASVGNAILPGDPFMSAASLSTYSADKLGLPSPENPYERIAGGVTRAVAGGGGFIGAGRTLARAPGLTGQVGSGLAAAPRAQLMASAGGGFGAETARESGAGPTGQAFAGLAGALTPSGGSSLARLLGRGGETGRQSMLANLMAFRTAGAGVPSLGQATEGRVGRGLEALLARTPGSSGVMARASESQQQGMGQRVRQVADSLSTRASPEQAGRGIERGITGPGGFMSSFRRSAADLYNRVDQFMPPTTPIQVARTKAVLDQLASPTPGAAATSRVLSSGKVADLRSALDTDLQASLQAAGRGELPYEAVKALRTRLGDLIADSTFATDVPTKQLKQVYAALTDDMSTAVQATKNPQAVQAVSRADAYYRAGMGRMEELERVIQRNGGPEKVFAAATSGSREGATTLRAVMQSLPDDGQKQLAAAVIRRMGRANPGAQNELGEEFSSERFLTMWNTLAPEAKSTLFGRFGTSYVRDMEAIAKVAANRRAGAQVFRNPSQTTDAAIQAGTVFSFLTSLGTGNIVPAAGIAGGVTLANVVARGLTSPRVVGWLAKQTSVPVAALPMQVARLKAEATAEGDQEALEFVDAIENAAPARR